MRPRRYAADNLPNGSVNGIHGDGFNEAAALRRG